VLCSDLLWTGLGLGLGVCWLLLTALLLLLGYKLRDGASYLMAMQCSRINSRLALEAGWLIGLQSAKVPGWVPLRVFQFPTHN
jgi:hypothetical protein